MIINMFWTIIIMVNLYSWEQKDATTGGARNMSTQKIHNYWKYWRLTHKVLFSVKTILTKKSIMYDECTFTAS